MSPFVRSALLCLLLSLAAQAADVVPADRAVVVTELVAPTARAALERHGVRVVVVAREASFVLPDALVPWGKAGAGIALRPPLDRRRVQALRSYAKAGHCRLVLHAEAGFALSDLAALEQVGPCFYELHLGSPPTLFAQRLARLRPASIVWEAGQDVPSTSALAQLAALPQPWLSVSEERALAAAAALAKLGDARLGLSVRVPGGLLPEPLVRVLQAPERAYRVRVVADGGLSLAAARQLRALTGVSVEVALEGAGALPSLTVDAVRTLQTPIDRPQDRGPLPDEADAPLLNFQRLR